MILYEDILKTPVIDQVHVLKQIAKCETTIYNSLMAKKTEYYKQLAENIESRQIPSWLSLDRQTLVGQILSLPTPDEIDARFDGKAVVEYYSR